MRSRLVSPDPWNSWSSKPIHRNRSTIARAGLLVTLTLAVLTTSTLSASAQATKTASTPPPELSRFDLYGGYGYLHPVNSDIGNVQYQPINPGAVVSATYAWSLFITICHSWS